MYWAGYARDLFTCSPRFERFWQEFLVVDVHFFFCSSVIIFLLVRMIHYIQGIVHFRNSRQAQSLSQSSPLFFSFCQDDKSKCPKIHRCWRFLFEVVATCPRIFTLSLFMSLLMAIHFLLAIYLIPEWENFGDSSSDWISCKRIEEACSAVEASVGVVSECEGHRECGEFPQARPSAELLGLFYFCRSCIVLFVGATFSLSTQNFMKVMDGVRGFLVNCGCLHSAQDKACGKAAPFKHLIKSAKRSSSGNASGSRRVFYTNPVHRPAGTSSAAPSTGSTIEMKPGPQVPVSKSISSDLGSSQGDSFMTASDSEPSFDSQQSMNPEGVGQSCLEPEGPHESVAGPGGSPPSDPPVLEMGD